VVFGFAMRLLDLVERKRLCNRDGEPAARDFVDELVEA
jgi:hypothetical protein